MSNASQLSNFPLGKRGPGLAEFETLLDLLPDALLLLDTRSQRILLANAKATELTTYTRAELQDMNLSALFVNPDLKTTWDRQSEEPRTWQSILIKRNKMWVEVQATLSEFPTQKKWALVAITEISELIQRESARQRQSQLWDCLHALSLAPQQADLDIALNYAIQAGMVLTGASTVTIYQVSGQNLELRRCSFWGDGLPEQLPSQDLGHLKAPHLWRPGKRTLCVLHQAARGAKFNYLATVPLGQPNALVGLLAVASSSLDPDEQLLPILQILAGAITTIIQHHAYRTNAQQSLDSQLHLNKIFEAAQEAVQDGVIVLSPELRILHLNRSAEATLGYSGAEIREQPVEKILIGPEALKQSLARAQKGAASDIQEELRLYRRSGQAFLAQVNVVPVKQEKELQGIVVLIQDLSEKEQIQAHAQQLEQRALLGEVTAVFAHEVRNPINNLSTGLQLMALNLPAEDPNQDVIARLQGDCDRLAELMKSVLSYAHPTEYEMEAVDLGLLIERQLERMRPKFAKANARHHLQVKNVNPLVRGNPRALEQVFSNLINNALQAMEGSENGQERTLAIKIQPAKTSGKSRYVEVSVADNGPGISKENQERIFQPFFTTKSSGTGLGLAITKRILTAHKGTIQVNTFPGGTVFHVQVPELEQGEGT